MRSPIRARPRAPLLLALIACMGAAQAGEPARVIRTGEQIQIIPAPGEKRGLAEAVQPLAHYLIDHPGLRKLLIEAESHSAASALRSDLARAGIDPLRLQAAGGSVSRGLRLTITAQGADPSGPDAAEGSWMRALSHGPPPQDPGPCAAAVAALVPKGPTRAWACHFAGPGRAHFARWRARARIIGPELKQAIAAAGLPAETYYLAMIESGFNPEALSRFGALGVWQLMPATARGFGLRVGGRRDERRAVRASTRAALTYLGRLGRRFEAQDLIWAAYNGGPQRLARAMAAVGGGDLGAMVAAGLLDPETFHFVYKIRAARLVDENWKSLLPAAAPTGAPFDTPEPAP